MRSHKNWTVHPVIEERESATSPCALYLGEPWFHPLPGGSSSALCRHKLIPSLLFCTFLSLGFPWVCKGVCWVYLLTFIHLLIQVFFSSDSGVFCGFSEFNKRRPEKAEVLTAHLPCILSRFSLWYTRRKMIGVGLWLAILSPYIHIRDSAFECQLHYATDSFSPWLWQFMLNRYPLSHWSTYLITKCWPHQGPLSPLPRNIQLSSW